MAKKYISVGGHMSVCVCVFEIFRERKKQIVSVSIRVCFLIELYSFSHHLVDLYI